jgi:drug/metabolite transporter (DMT)-like permease
MTMTTGNPATERLRGIASMIAAVFVFAIMDASMKRLSSHYGLFQVSSLRCFASLLFLALPIVWQRSWATLQPKFLTLHIFRAVLGVTMLGCFVFAVRRLTLAQTYSLFLCAPLLMTALSVPIYKEHVPARRWFAILFGLGGVLVMLQPSGKGFGSMPAAIAAAVGAACYALSALTVRSLGRSNSSTSMVFWFLLMVGIGSGALSLGDWHPVASGDWGWLASIGLSGALGQFWLTDAFRRAPASVVGPFEYISILWAFAIDWVFWSASPTQELLIGAGIVIASGVFIIWDERRLAQLVMNPACPPP